MFDLYSGIAKPTCLQAQETRRFPSSLTERHLQVLWLEQKFLKNLMTLQGEKIEVISPGIWNKEAGPDFLKAQVRIGEHIYHGDIEIHIHEEGWTQHGHHRDPRYNRVILHICYYHLQQPLLINKENGQQAYSCYLEQSLTLPIEQLVDLIDFDLYALDFYPNKGRCAELLFASLPDRQIQQFFQSAAYWRLEKKLNFLQLAYPTRSLQFACGIAMALGYRHNAKPFLDLFQYLLHFRDLPYQELLAIALGCCGFLEEGRKKSWENSSYYQFLRTLWWGKKDQVSYQAYLKLDRIRPFHHPARRLAYLAHFLQDRNLEEGWSRIVNLWEDSMARDGVSLIKLQKQLLALLPVYQDEYWGQHYTFDTRMRKASPLGIGQEMKLQILLNTTLPLLYAATKESGNAKRWEKFQEFYSLISIPQTSKSRYLHQRFLSEQKNEDLFEDAQMIQGAYQLHHDFCTHFEASCNGCPFVERYQNMHSTKR